MRFWAIAEPRANLHANSMFPAFALLKFSLSLRLLVKLIGAEQG
jgi:hypothetical protein